MTSEIFGKLRYLPKLADLMDRLSIDLLKATFITKYKDEYVQEMLDIMHDIDLILENNPQKLDSNFIRDIMLIALLNREIWLNESKARSGTGEQDKLLKFTHSLNGVRNTAKNNVSYRIGDRKDLKIDSLAEEFLSKDFIFNHGDWGIYPSGSINTLKLNNQELKD